MPLPFMLVCDLLDQSYELCLARKDNTQAVIEWFAQHRDRINSPGCNLAALLSTLLPEKRTDRVYCIQAPRLERIISRALMLGSSRIKELAVYKQPGQGLDLADCVERILSPNPTRPERLQVTVEEIDDALHGIASKIRWSSPSVRIVGATLSQPGQSDLEAIYRQLSPREAKWFTRLVLKDYQPLIFEPHLIYCSCDPMLPFMLKIQDDFATAIKSTQQVRLKMRPTLPRTLRTDRKVLATITPQLSIKVGRQQWFKARSIKHCIDLCQGHMSVETKIDGEYCQIHVDVSKGRQGIRIFSKSGKDSTEDRHALVGIIWDSLKIGKPGCNVQKGCILEGELAVYSDHEQKILPFHHIRKHVTRRGRFMGTEHDSPPRPYEHLMMVYYDMLLLDGESFLNIKHSERFKLLEKTIHCSIGQAELVPRQVIDTNHGFAASALRKIFAKIIIERGEGLVLKSDLPYFNFSDNGRPFSGRCIKLKKEYIGKFGEVGDFAVVGAGFSPPKAKSYDVENLKWTHFYVGCLDNREEVKRWGATPDFTVVNEVELNETMLKSFISYGNPMPVPIEENHSTNFEKAGNTGFWGLRFPAVAKIHFDRDFTDAVSFEELQAMAREAVTAPELEDSQENIAWIAKLESADPRGLAVDALTQRTATTAPSPSPMRPSQVSASCPSLAGGATNSQHSIKYWQAFYPPASRSCDFDETPPPRLMTSVSSTPFTTNQNRSLGLSKKRRSLPTAVVTSPSHKRRKYLEADNTHPPTFLGTKTKPSSRRPLEDIDGNSTQRSTTSYSSFSQHMETQGENVMEQPAPEQSQSMSIRNPQEPKLLSKSSCALDTSVIIISDGEDQTTHTTIASLQAHMSQVSCVVGAQEAVESPAPEIQDACQYAGPKCQLAKKTILLLPGLPVSATELAPLFKAHGLVSIITDAETWANEDQLRSTSTQGWQPGPNKLLLVDTIEMKTETRQLLACIEAIRNDMPEGRRDWISVYDWRVLKHVSILEDDSVTKKYYDGFHDPWRRWYCGLV
ncbi:hypothetical protein PT974_06885 [Cladobotryum mycophilum]|uniref:ATP-dependent DNA ligase family profile domain-containing protein n=1 Tax=Cladobotryum mycophilum TaxID=491253 RepID=A0ABR0SN09_9HYPO